MLDGAIDSAEIRLHPLATVKAKLVNDDGEPVAGASLQFYLIGKNRVVIRGAQPSALGNPVADKDGNFTQMIVPGDYVYWIPKFNSGSGEKEIELKPGATLDLGTININKRLAEPKTSEASGQGGCLVLNTFCILFVDVFSMVNSRSIRRLALLFL